ncbi:MAG TPA: hypothetical protein VGN26_09300 [Armatimonadota bacterium]|jgi:hypothetical protein
MVKVNLLPGYYFEARKTRNALIVMMVALLAVGSAMAYLVTGTMADQQALDEAIAAAQPAATLSDKLSSDASAVNTAITSVKQKTTYIKQVLDFNKLFPLLFEETNKYTTPQVALSQLQPAVSILNISGYVQNLSDIGRFLLSAQSAKHLFSAVSITQGVPGWPPPEAGTDVSSVASAPSPAAGPASYGPTPGGGSPYGPAGGATPGGGGAGAGPGGNPQPGPVAFGVGSSIDLGGGYRFVSISAKPQPSTLPFTAVAQLQAPFVLTPPTSPYLVATDATGGATPGSYGPTPTYGPTPGGSGGAPPAPSNGASGAPGASSEETGGLKGRAKLGAEE